MEDCAYNTMLALALALVLDIPLTVLHHLASDVEQLESLNQVSDYCMFKHSGANVAICT